MNYTTLVDSILEAERSARAISDEGLERQAHLDEELAAQRRRLEEEYLARTRERLDKLLAQAQAEKEKTLAAQDARLTDAKQKIEQAYRRYGDNWVDTLFHQVVDPS